MKLILGRWGEHRRLPNGIYIRRVVLSDVDENDIVSGMCG